MHQMTRKDVVLLLFLILFWGLNWPVMKASVRDFPPLTFRTLSMFGGLAVIARAARLQRASMRIPQGEVLTVVKLAIPNMLFWHAFIIIGVKLLSSGRAAILGYTMPVWAVLSGLVFFGDRVNGRALFGIALAMTGAGLLLSSEFAHMTGQPIGMLFALIAAAAWGFGTVLMKRTKLEMPTISLTFWMLVLTTIAMALLSALFERAQWRLPNTLEWGGIVYNAVIIFGYAHVVWFRLARLLPPVVSSLSVMFIPVLGTFAGAWMLGEQQQWQDYAAIVLILGSMSTVMFGPRKTDQ